MSYSEEEIKRYLEILHNYTKPEVEENRISKCCNCQRSDCFTILSILTRYAIIHILFGCSICVIC